MSNVLTFSFHSLLGFNYINFFEGGSPTIIQAGLELTGSQDHGEGLLCLATVLFQLRRLSAITMMYVLYVLWQLCSETALTLHIEYNS